MEVLAAGASAVITQGRSEETVRELTPPVGRVRTTDRVVAVPRGRLPKKAVDGAADRELLTVPSSDAVWMSGPCPDGRALDSNRTSPAIWPAGAWADRVRHEEAA